MSTRDIDGQMVLPLVDTGLLATLANRITPGWYRQAACADTPGDVFYPDPGERDAHVEAAAVAVCNGCRVRSSCRATALLKAEHGVWGGTTDDDRDRMHTQLASGTSVDAVLIETIRVRTETESAA